MIAVLCLHMVTTVPSTAPSAAVLDIQTRGVSTDTADILTGMLLTQLRDSGRFSRVMGTRDVAALLGFEQQKQLVACDSDSCLAEVAGTLGVEQLVTGSVGRVGDTHIMTITLLDARNAVALASVSRTVAGGKEEGLLTELPLAVTELLAKSAPTSTAGPPKEPTARQPVTATGGGGIRGSRVLVGVGGAALAAAAVPALVGAASMAAAVTTWLAYYLVPVPAPRAIGGAYLGFWALSLAAGAALVLLAGVGTALLLAGWVVA